MYQFIQYCFVSSVLFLTACHILHAQKITAKVVVEGKLREFIVVRPSGAVPAGGYPMVFMVHGTGGDGEKFYNISQWVERGEKDKIVTVFPSSLAWCHKEKDGTVVPQLEKWVNGDLMDGYCGKTQDLITEELFFRKMVDTISSVLPVNHKKIFVAGFSNGGGMSQKLFVQASDIFSAFASNAGSFHVLDTGRTKRKVPLMYAVGTIDQAYITPMGISAIPFNDSCFKYLGGVVSRTLSVMDLTDQYTLYANDKTRTYVFNTPKPGAEPNTYIFTLIKGAEHVYPNGTLHELVMADIHWEFFKTLSVPSSLITSVETEEISREQFLHPNPASDFITLHDIPEHTENIFITNAVGATVLTIPASGGNTINVSALPNGLYSITAGTSRSTFLIAR